LVGASSFWYTQAHFNYDSRLIAQIIRSLNSSKAPVSHSHILAREVIIEGQLWVFKQKETSTSSYLYSKLIQIPTRLLNMDEILASLKQNTHSPGSHEQVSSSGQNFEGSSAIPDAHVRRRKSLLDLFRPRGVTEYELLDASGEQHAAASANPFFSLTRSMSRGRSALHRSLSRSRSSSPVKDSNGIVLSFNPDCPLD
jgi:hypothetical protein